MEQQRARAAASATQDQASRSAPAEAAAAPALVRQSLLLSFAERYTGIILQFVATTILARLLTPADYGVYTIAFVVVNLAQMVRDFGTIGYLYQERNLTETAIRTAFGVSLMIGIGLGAATALSSGAIGQFYDSEGVHRVLLVLSVNFLLIPFGSTTVALLRREMNFSALFVIQVAGTSANFLVAIGYALVYGGYMSLAWGSLAASAATCVASAVFQPRQFVMLPSLKDWRRITSFGVIATIGTLLGELGTRSPELLIGHFIGLPAVGLFSRADGLILMFNRLVTSGVAPVAVSAFAQQHRSGTSLQENFRHATAMITGIAWPFFVVLGLLASPITHILFGGQWDAVIPIARLLCVAACIAAISYLTFYALQAMGEVKSILLVQLIVQPLKIGALVVASRGNLMTVAATLILTELIAMVAQYTRARRLLGTSLADMAQATLRSMGVTAFAAAVPILVVLFMQMDDTHIWLPFAVGALGAIAGWVLGVRLFRHALWAEVCHISAVSLGLVGLHRTIKNTSAIGVDGTAAAAAGAPSRRRDVLVVSSNFPPVIGGSSVVYDHLCRNAPNGVTALGASRNYETGLAWPDLRAQDKARNYKIRRIPYLRPGTYAVRSRSPWRFGGLFDDLFVMLRALCAIVTACIRHRVHTVCIGELTYNGWLVFPLRYLLRRNVVIYTHGEEIWENEGSTATRMRGSFLRHSNAIISVSQFCKAAIVSKYGVPPERIFVLHNGVDLGEFHKGSNDSAVIPEPLRGKRIILSISRLISRKGHEYLLRAMPQILAHVPDAHCLVVGDGPLAPSLRSLACELGIADHVTFLGPIAQDAIAPLYRASDVFVLPCHTLENGDTEGFGLVFIEANACGLAVVAGAAGGTIEAVIDGETGLIVDGTKPDEIADATCRILGDRELALRLAEGGWRRAQACDWSQVASEFLRICRKETRAQPSAGALYRPARDKITLAPADRPSLLVTIDVEEQFDWNEFTPEKHRVAGLERLEEFHGQCQKIGISPVLLATYPMLFDPGFTAFFRRVLREKSAEVGVHVHPWNTPPFWETNCVFNSYQCNLPAHVERRKLETIVRRYEELFGVRPRIHRAGRWGANWRTLDLVEELGFAVDLSFCSGYSDARGGGPDMRRLGNLPFWSGEEGAVLVIPASSVNYLRGPDVSSIINFAFREKWPVLHEKFSFMIPGTPVRFSPEGQSLQNLTRMARQLQLQRQPVAVLTLHSTSLYGGGSRYVETATASNALISNTIDALAVFINVLGFRPVTCGQLYDELRPRHEALRTAATIEPSGPISALA